MENVTDALYMGFAVLAFTLAITISIGAFTQVTQVSNYIVESKDKETNYTYVDYQGEETERIVSGESILPTLYRAPKENYIVRFFNNDKQPYTVYSVKDTKLNQFVATNEIDLRSTVVGNQENARIFLDKLLEGKLAQLLSNDKTNFGNFSVNGTDLQDKSFYDILKRNKFVETLGIYYEDDLIDNDADDINKTEVRLITYTATEPIT